MTDSEHVVSSEAISINKPILYLLNIILFLGILVSAYLTHHYLNINYGAGSSGICDFGAGFSCSQVTASEYSAISGIPISIIGLITYSSLFILVLTIYKSKRLSSLYIVCAIGALSVLYSLYLIYVSKVILDTFCPFCIVLYVVNFLIPIFSYLGFKKAALNEGLFSGITNPKDIVTLTASLVVSSFVFGGIYSIEKNSYLKESTSVAEKKQSSGDKTNIEIDATMPSLGSKDAKVKFIVYEDFQCGFCKKLSNNIKTVYEKYSKDLFVGFKHFPMHQDCNISSTLTKSLHPNACDASMAAECANQQGQFWEYYEILFKNQSKLKKNDLKKYAEDLSLNMEQFSSCMNDPVTLEKIRQDTKSAEPLNISGTPALFINGKQHSGAQSIEVLSALIEAELAGKSLSNADLQNVEKTKDITGLVSAPEMVKLQGPFGEFEIDSFEASLEGNKANSKSGNKPKTNVSWFEANDFCKEQGKRLCTEAEWITACSGEIPLDTNNDQNYANDYIKGSTLPYGDSYKPGICNTQLEPPKNIEPGKEPPLPDLLTGNYPQCKSKFGVYDMVGNIREWVGTVPSKSAIFGGAFYHKEEASCFHKLSSAGPLKKHDSIGFRCCKGGNVDEKVSYKGGEVGEILQNFSLKTIDNKQFDSKSLKGKPALLTFWASWCGPCRKELPAYNSVYKELKSKGFEIIAINIDTEVEQAISFLEKTPLDFPIVLDTSSELKNKFDVQSMPTAFLINKKGMIVIKKSGYEAKDEIKLKETAEKLLAE